MTWREYGWLLPGASVALAAGILAGRAAGTWYPFALALLCALGVLPLLRGRSRIAGIMAVVLALGSLMGFAAYHPVLPPEGEYLISGVVVEEITTEENGHVKTMLTAITLDGQRLSGSGYWSFYLRGEEGLPQGLEPGCRVTFSGRLYHPRGPEQPGGFDFREYLLQRGARVGLYGCTEPVTEHSGHPLGLAAALRNRLTETLIASMGETAGGYAATMLLGGRNLILQEDRQAFNRLGIAHILSVSGFHVGILAGVMAATLKKLHLSRRLRFVLLTAVLAAYALLTGLKPPVIRAAVLYMLYEFGALKHRQRSGLHLLCASWMLQLLASPTQLTGLSFQLTYGAMLGLILVTPWLEAQYTPRRVPRLWKLLCATLGAQAGILLPQLYWFQEIPLLGTVLNLGVIALAAGMMHLWWLTLLFLWFSPLAELLGRLTAVLLDGMLMVVRFLGSLPGITLWTCQASVVTALGAAVLIWAASWWWPFRRRIAALAACLAVIALSVWPWPHGDTEYIQFSVGEEDAALIWDKDAAVAIDAGENGSELADFLHQRRLKLDALVLTHLHVDHAGGVAELLAQRIPVEVCYLPWNAREALVDAAALELLRQLEETGTRVKYLGRGDQIPLPGGSLTVMWPERGRVRSGQEANFTSMTMLAELHGSTMLLTGDLDGQYEMYAAAPADVLKAAHHGSAGSTSEAFLEAVSPQLIILSCGNQDRVLAMNLRRGAIPMMDTDASGAIMIKFDADGFSVKTMR